MKPVLRRVESKIKHVGGLGCVINVSIATSCFPLWGGCVCVYVCQGKIDGWMIMVVVMVVVKGVYRVCMYICIYVRERMRVSGWLDDLHAVLLALALALEGGLGWKEMDGEGGLG